MYQALPAPCSAHPCCRWCSLNVSFTETTSESFSTAYVACLVLPQGGTPEFVAPELLVHPEFYAEKGCGPAIDVWALGIILYFLLCGKVSGMGLVGLLYYQSSVLQQHVIIIFRLQHGLNTGLQCLKHCWVICTAGRWTSHH
jgi:serine/threonine protein kinase